MLRPRLRDARPRLLDARAQAATDSLTSLSNHRAFQQRIREDVQRASKTVGANTTNYVWSNVGSLLVILYDGNYYAYGLGLISKTDSQSNQLYYLADGLGSTTGLTDGQGNVVGTYSYDAFGATRSETGGQANDFRFTGQQLDNETAFYYLRARYYDAGIGRFLTRDPFGGFLVSPQSLNRYPYSVNDPINLVDP